MLYTRAAAVGRAPIDALYRVVAVGRAVADVFNLHFEIRPVPWQMAISEKDSGGTLSRRQVATS